jgi:hypothetical protein
MTQLRSPGTPGAFFVSLCIVGFRVAPSSWGPKALNSQELWRPELVFVEGVLNMARSRLGFKQTDLTRALRAASAAGQPVQRFEIDREGKIVMFVGKSEQQDDTEGNEWDNI